MNEKGRSEPASSQALCWPRSVTHPSWLGAFLMDCPLLCPKSRAAAKFPAILNARGVEDLRAWGDSIQRLSVLVVVTSIIDKHCLLDSPVFLPDDQLSAIVFENLDWAVVEVLEEVESSFGFEIPEFTELPTIGHLIDHIVSALPTNRESEVCAPIRWPEGVSAIAPVGIVPRLLGVANPGQSISDGFSAILESRTVVDLEAWGSEPIRFYVLTIVTCMIQRFQRSPAIFLPDDEVSALIHITRKLQQSSNDSLFSELTSRFGLVVSGSIWPDRLGDLIDLIVINVLERGAESLSNTCERCGDFSRTTMCDRCIDREFIR